MSLSELGIECSRCPRVDSRLRRTQAQPPLPVFFVSVDSKWVNISVSRLESALVESCAFIKAIIQAEGSAGAETHIALALAVGLERNFY